MHGKRQGMGPPGDMEAPFRSLLLARHVALWGSLDNASVELRHAKNREGEIQPRGNVVHENGPPLPEIHGSPPLPKRAPFFRVVDGGVFCGARQDVMQKRGDVVVSDQPLNGFCASGDDEPSFLVCREPVAEGLP